MTQFYAHATLGSDSNSGLGSGAADATRYNCAVREATVLNATLYTVTIDGSNYSYTTTTTRQSDIWATIADAINADGACPVTAQWSGSADATDQVDAGLYLVAKATGTTPTVSVTGGTARVDSLGSYGAFLTLDAALNGIAQQCDTLWITGTFTLTGSLPLETKNRQAFIYFNLVGYGTTPGDRGLATLDCSGIAVSPVNITAARNAYERYANLRILDNTNYAFTLFNSEHTFFENVHIDANGGGGWYPDRYCYLTGCSAVGTVIPFNGFSYNFIVGCDFEISSSGYMKVVGGPLVFAFNTVSGLTNSNSGFAFECSNTTDMYFINNSFYGDPNWAADSPTKDNRVAINNVGDRNLIVNNVLSGYPSGISFNGHLSMLWKNVHGNHFYNVGSSDADYLGDYVSSLDYFQTWDTALGEGNYLNPYSGPLAIRTIYYEGDPKFTDPATGDFTLQPTSPLINAGQAPRWLSV